MKKFCDIELNLNWPELLAGVSSKHNVLLNKPNGDFLFAWDAIAELIVKPGEYNAEQLEQFIQDHPKNYILGYLSYDIKNDETRHLPRFEDQNTVNDLHFIVPKHVMVKKRGKLVYFGALPQKEAEEMIQEILTKKTENPLSSPIVLHEKTARENYVDTVSKIKQNIQAGIIYEMNYCVNFKNAFEAFNPSQTYTKLCAISEAPFASYISFDHTVILSASPERFLSKKGDILMSQPIKGTAKRGVTPQQDAEVIEKLTKDPKEISENVMIVDLVRNDLSKIAQKNSVTVDELCKPYTFKTVHQLISTISCKIKPEITFTQIMQALFPMGSMTGAPKISAIKNIHHFETFNRGIYSGAIGCIEPNGNFDYNVVIRTLVADLQNNEISCSVGGAITINSTPSNEYDECRLKLNALEKTLC